MLGRRQGTIASKQASLLAGNMAVRPSRDKDRLKPSINLLPRVKNTLPHVVIRRYSGDMSFLFDTTSGIGEPTEKQREQLFQLEAICAGVDVTITYDELASMLHKSKTRDKAIVLLANIIRRKLIARRDTIDFKLAELKRWRAGDGLLDHAAATEAMPTDCALTTD